MHLVVTVPERRLTERRYILDVVLKRFLGISFVLELHGEQTVKLSMPGAPGYIELPDRLFSVPDGIWGEESSLPEVPLPRMPLGDDEELVALYSADDVRRGITVEGDRLWLPIDVFGGGFYLLSRYEEIAAPKLAFDQHGRFAARSSLASHEGFLELPLLDEYISLLVRLMLQVWNCSPSARPAYKPVVTHDVDHPLSTAGARAALVMRQAVGDIVRRRDPAMMFRRMRSFVERDSSSDPNNTFDWLMDQSERIGVVSRFHFMAADKTRYDSGYDIGSSALAGILRRIDARGHEIGIHPSYRTSVEPTLFDAEVRRLQMALEKAGVKSWSCTSRQHYLRWKADSTWSALSAIGIKEDSSVGFADAAGFRCGTARLFPTYDWQKGQELELRELPLIVMDVTLSGKNYLGLEWEAALEKVVDLCRQCRKHGTPFTILWHNDKVMSQADKRRYLDMLEGIA